MKLLAIIKITRPINFVITFLSVIIAAMISSSIFDIGVNVLLLAFSLGFTLIAGNVINDIIDFEIDKVNRPERALPKELLSIDFAKGIYVFSIITALLTALLISIYFFFIIAAFNILIGFYSTHLKAIILISNLTVAIATATPFILGGLVVNNVEGGIIPAGFAFFTNFIREIIKDIEDIKGDSSKGVITFPQKAGVNKAVYFAFFLILLLMLLATFPFVFGIYNAEYFVIIMVFVNPVFAYTLKLLYTNRALPTLKKVSSLIKLNMILGLIAILIGAQ
ncbi:MAG TPA: hypothetical protein ENN33_10585 [Ignavibacteria bacterium]|nr:hypothetical protein [Ignavibacteria bacterium]